MADPPKVGRGAKIAQLLLSRNPGQSSSDEAPAPPGRVRVGTESSGDEDSRSQISTISRGRGALLTKLAKSSESDDASSAIGASGGDTSSAGRGRGGFLSQLRAQRDTTSSDEGISSAPSFGRGKLLSLVKPASAKSSTPSPSPPETPGKRTPEKELTKRLEGLSVSDSPPVVAKGCSGQQTRVSCNYITLTTDPDMGVFEFEVRFSPDIDYKAFRYKLINEEFKSKRGIRCYDGGDKLYLPKKVTDSRLIFDKQHPNDGTPVKVIVIFKRKMRLRDCAHLYNVLFNNCSHVLKLARLGRQYFDPSNKHIIPQHKLEVWPGYVTSVDEFEGGIHLCCDTLHRVLRTETPYDVLLEMTEVDPVNYKTLTEKQLLGQCVLTRYNNNLYRIDDIEWTKNPNSTFKLANGTEMTFYEYYERQYNLDIRDLGQPLLVNKAKKHRKDEKPRLICLIPELCFMTGLTDRMRQDYKVMKDIATYTRVTPPQRDLAFRKFIKSLQENSDAKQMLEDWGLRLAPEPLQLDARVLAPEGVAFGLGNRMQGSRKAEWLKDVKGSPVFRAVDINHWILVHHQRDSKRAQSFVSMILKCGPGMGIKIRDPIVVPLRDDRIDAYIRGIKDNVDNKTQIVVVLCPTARDDRYAAIKRLCCRELPIPSQVVNSPTISKEDKMRAVVQNIALQMNNKLGGAGWAIKIPLKNTMICGIDSYHDAGKKGNSVGAFVASLDNDYTTYFSRICIQLPKQELIDGLVQCFVAALRKFLLVNNTLPEKIVIFRDGVGDGQLKICREHEVTQFLNACKMVNPEYTPKLSVVIVQKRINTRFYQHLDPQGRNLANPAPGSVLDHTITRRNYYDFFLVSQHVNQGTATPSHYIVVYDTSEFTPDIMQRLAYKFCHLYYNWPGAIRVPAPCQYAHKLAYLVGQNVKGLPAESLEDKLYYL